ncbi:uncharacterized protein LOC141600550 [Silene latifolia]|uniref:uncharacterized protein LOC141600550 n=1 Tax=Silene latifolia TaxID=37657 RepID=UPI003D787BE7
MLINSAYSDWNKAESDSIPEIAAATLRMVEEFEKMAESDNDPEIAAAELRMDEEFEKMREEWTKRRQCDGAMPAKPMAKFPGMSDEAFEIKRQELSAMVAKAVSEKSTMPDETAFKRRKQLLFAHVAHAVALNENSTLSTETLVKRKLELSALTDKIRQEFM